MDAKRVQNAFKINLKTHLKTDAIFGPKNAPQQSLSKSLLRFHSGRETAKKKLKTTNHFPTNPNTPRARSGPVPLGALGPDLSCLRQYTRSGPMKVR